MPEVWIIVDVKKKKTAWKPDPKYTDILRIYFDMGMTAYTAKNQRVPPNKYGIKNMPDYKTVMKYWRYWKDEHNKEHMGELAQIQRDVKSQFTVAYDKQIMVSESLLQEYLRYKEEAAKAWDIEQTKKVEKGNQKFKLPMRPDLALDSILIKINELEGDQKMAKGALMAAPIVDQMSEEAVLQRMEARREAINEEIKKLKNG